MMRGRKPLPTAVRRLNGNPGKRGYNSDEPLPPDGAPECPEHLSGPAHDEWERLAGPLYAMGVLTEVDRAPFAAYCQAYGRWVEAEHKLRDLPPMVKTPSGYVQQNPWMGVANKQMEMMGRFAAEFGLTPSARCRVMAGARPTSQPVLKVIRVITDFPRDDDDDRHPSRIDPTGR